MDKLIIVLIAVIITMIVGIVCFMIGKVKGTIIGHHEADEEYLKTISNLEASKKSDWDSYVQSLSDYREDAEARINRLKEYYNQRIGGSDCDE